MKTIWFSLTFLCSCVLLHASSDNGLGCQWLAVSHVDGAGPVHKRGPLFLRGGSTTVAPELKARLEQLLQSSHVMLFIKGSPDKPQVK